MNLTAKQFNKNPAAAYRAADKGEEVIITHDRFDADFVLTSKNAEYEAMKRQKILDDINKKEFLKLAEASRKSMKRKQND